MSYYLSVLHYRSKSIAVICEANLIFQNIAFTLFTIRRVLL